MNKMLPMLGLAVVLMLGCGESSAPVSKAGAANTTTLASISPENKATCVYDVAGMT